MAKQTKYNTAEYPLTEEEMVDFLSGNMASEDKLHLENALAESSFLADSMEGLQAFESLTEAQRAAFQINQQLLQNLKSKNKAKKIQPLGLSSNWVIGIVVIVALILIAFALVKMMGNGKV